MKKQAFILAALIGAATAQAQSQTPASQSFYVTAAGGSTHANLDCTGSTACDKSDTGGKLVGGYQFGNGLSLEVGYISFGKFSARDNTLSLTLKSNAVLIGGAYALPLNNDWGLNLRLGLAQVKTTGDATMGAATGSVSKSKAKTYVGAGVTYAISPTVKIELGADSTQAEIEGEKGTLRMFSLGATFAF
jgi:OOP family OmpA-OmpF porin